MRSLTLIVVIFISSLISSAALSCGFVALPSTADDSKRVDIRYVRAAIVHSDGIETLVVQAGCTGNTGKFAWIIPTPPKAEVIDLPSDLSQLKSDLIYDDLDRITARRYRYWFNTDFYVSNIFSSREWSELRGRRVDEKRPEPQATLSISGIKIISPKSAEELREELKILGYKTPATDSSILGCIKQGRTFTVITLNGKNRTYRDLTCPVVLTFPTKKPIVPPFIGNVDPGNRYVELHVFAKHPLRASSLQTECAFSCSTRGFRVWMGETLDYLTLRMNRPHISLEKLSLSKLTGTTNVAELALEPTDKVVRPARVSVALLENIGALSVAALPIILPLLFIFTPCRVILRRKICKNAAHMVLGFVLAGIGEFSAFDPGASSELPLVIFSLLAVLFIALGCRGLGWKRGSLWFGMAIISLYGWVFCWISIQQNTQIVFWPTGLTVIVLALAFTGLKLRQRFAFYTAKKV